MNYDQIRAALSAYIHRTDAATISNEPTALELSLIAVGASFFVREALKAVDVSLVAGAAALPVGFGRAEVIGADLAYKSLREWAGDTAAQRQGCFTIQGSTLLVGGEPDGPLPIVYYELPVSISGAQANWLSTGYPSVWIHAARAEQYRFIEDISAANEADALWRGQADVFAGESRRVESRGGAIRMRSR